MDIYDKIREGAYESKRPYPAVPNQPVVLLKPAGQLTDAELDELPRIRARYRDALTKYREDRDAHQQEGRQLIEAFWADLAGEHKLPSLMSDPFLATMKGMAWERGYAKGLAEVAREFEDLMLLWEIHVKVRRPAALAADDPEDPPKNSS